MSNIASFLPGTAARLNSFINAERWFFSPTYWPMHIAIGTTIAVAVHFFRAFTENYIENTSPQRNKVWDLILQDPFANMEQLSNAINELDNTDKMKELVNISMHVGAIAAGALLFISALFFKGPQRRDLFLSSCAVGTIGTYFVPLYKKNKYKYFFISSAVLAASVGWMEWRK